MTRIAECKTCGQHKVILCKGDCRSCYQKKAHARRKEQPLSNPVHAETQRLVQMIGAAR